ncbi:MAG: hypothetical protein AAFO15_01930 [Pseudomonadota bacterium]
MAFTKTDVEKLSNLSQLKLNHDITNDFLENFNKSIELINKIKDFSVDTLDNDSSYLKKNAIPIESLRKDISHNNPEIIKKMPHIYTNHDDNTYFQVPKTVNTEGK